MTNEPIFPTPFEQMMQIESLNMHADRAAATFLQHAAQLDMLAEAISLDISEPPMSEEMQQLYDSCMNAANDRLERLRQWHAAHISGEEEGKRIREALTTELNGESTDEEPVSEASGNAHPLHAIKLKDAQALLETVVALLHDLPEGTDAQALLEAAVALMHGLQELEVAVELMHGLQEGTDASSTGAETQYALYDPQETAAPSHAPSAGAGTRYALQDYNEACTTPREDPEEGPSMMFHTSRVGISDPNFEVIVYLDDDFYDLNEPEEAIKRFYVWCSNKAYSQGLLTSAGHAEVIHIIKNMGLHFTLNLGDVARKIIDDALAGAENIELKGWIKEESDVVDGILTAYAISRNRLTKYQSQ